MPRFQTVWQRSFSSDQNYPPLQAHLLGDTVVVGEAQHQTFTCLERSTGTVRWQRQLSAANGEVANAIMGATEGVLVLSEFRSQGFLDAFFGSYRYSLQTGEPLENPSHHSGWKQCVPWLDSSPSVNDTVMQAPMAVREGRITTNDGHVMDAQTGRVIEQISSAAVKELRVSLERPDMQLALGKRFILPQGDVIQAGLPGTPNQNVDSYEGTPLQFFRVGKRGQVKWVFDAQTLGWELKARGSGFIQQRVVSPYMFFLRPYHPASSPASEPVSAHYELHTLDLETGLVVATYALSEETLASATITDADDKNLLFSCRVADGAPEQVTLLAY